MQKCHLSLHKIKTDNVITKQTVYFSDEEVLFYTADQSINQSKHICIAPCVAKESEAHGGEDL